MIFRISEIGFCEYEAGRGLLIPPSWFKSRLFLLSWSRFAFAHLFASFDPFPSVFLLFLTCNILCWYIFPIMGPCFLLGLISSNFPCFASSDQIEHSLVAKLQKNKKRKEKKRPAFSSTFREKLLGNKRQISNFWSCWPQP